MLNLQNQLKVKYTAQINDHFKIDISQEELDKSDIIRIDDQHFHIVKNGQSLNAKVVSADFERKAFLIRINGRDYDIQLKDSFDRLVSEMGLSVVSGAKVKDVKAPMPGLVLDVNVDPGQDVKKGDKLLILEAMKMENVIKSDGDGTVKAVHIDKGAAVDKGQLLIEME